MIMLTKKAILLVTWRKSEGYRLMNSSQLNRSVMYDIRITF